MRLTLHTDYALRVLIHVGRQKGDLVTINEIAECYGISKNHLTKVVHQLGRSGYLETVRGKYGGVRLLRNPEDVKLGEFIRETEEDFTLVRCMRCNSAEECRLSDGCIARDALSTGLTAFFKVLDGYTLADMLAEERQAAE
jgi:Rrf2 family transcriptional regulator, nitric oxide-sensitive transcriptional repressor